MNKNQFDEVMLPLSVIFTEGLNDEQYKIYIEIFKDCDYERMKIAVMTVLKTYTYITFPKPGYIYDIYEESQIPVWTPKMLRKAKELLDESKSIS